MGMCDDPRQLDTLLCSHQSDSRGEGGDQPPPSHAWSRSLIADMFQEDHKEWITKALALASGEAILFFGRWSCKEGLSYTSARDVGFILTDAVNWAARTVQVEVTVNTVPEACWAIANVVMEKKMKAKKLGHPPGSGRALWSSAGTCNIDDWMWGLDEGVSDGEVRRTSDYVSLDMVDDASDREHQGFLEVLPEAHPLQEVGVLIEGVINALCTWQWWEHPATVTDQCMPKEVSE